MKGNRTMDGLGSILKKNKVDSGEPHTHVTKLCEPGNVFPGCYYFNNTDEEKLLEAICEAVARGKKLTIAEKREITGLAPLTVDFDFLSPLPSNLEDVKRQYTVDTLKTLVKFYQDAIFDIIEPSSFVDDMLICIVLEKETPRVIEEGLKDGFHFHFPNFICNTHIQDIYLRNKVIAKVIESNLLPNANIITKPDKAIDITGTKPWMMYGSMNYKNETSTPYLYNRRQSKIEGTTFTAETDPWRHVSRDKQYGHVFDHKQKEVPILSIFNDEMDGRPHDIKYYLPRFLKIRGYQDETPLKPRVIENMYNRPDTYVRKTKKVISNRNDEDIYKDIKTIQEGHFMDMLSIDRADDHDSWMDVGWTLFNITCGKEEGLKLWDDFSMRSSRYTPCECEKRWNTMEMRDKTIGSLIWMVNKDNPGEYANYKKTNTTYYLYESVKPAKHNEYDVMRVFVSRAGDRFKCIKPRGDIWVEFKDHRWRETEDAIRLKVFIIEDVLQQYQDFIYDLSNKIRDPETCDPKDEYFRKNAIKIVDALKTVPFQKRLVEMCKLKLTDETFLKKVNENRMLVCCENGVLDLELNLFREGRPDDYCTFSTGIHYHNYNPWDEDVAFFDKFMRKIFPNERLRDYFLDVASSCLEGGNVNKRVFVCTGGTGGGKSVTIEILENAFGDYFGKFPRELFIKGRGANSAQARPELSQTPGRKIMSSQEITHMEQFNLGIVKELSGADSMFFRGNYKDGGKNASQYTIILQCNKPPNMPDDDEAFWTRMCLIDFESTFILASRLREFPVPDSEEEQFEKKRFHAEPGFVKKYRFLSEVMLWKIFIRFAQYKERGGLVDPEEVKVSTNKYRNSNDVFKRFEEDKLEKQDDEKAGKCSITMTEIYNEFKDWYKENYPAYSREPIGKTIVRNKLIERIGLVKDGKNDEKYGFDKDKRGNYKLWGYELLLEEGVMTVLNL